MSDSVAIAFHRGEIKFHQDKLNQLLEEKKVADKRPESAIAAEAKRFDELKMKWQPFIEEALRRFSQKLPIPQSLLDASGKHEKGLRAFVSIVKQKHNQDLLQGMKFLGCTWSLRDDEDEDRCWWGFTVDPSCCNCGAGKFSWCTDSIDWFTTEFSLHSTTPVGHAKDVRFG
ncbi:MAG: hypothetical protein Harvfovirus3_47 [Harvfovirus sp.]|uniref:Uncharacterized protein n=1 Tax=Harvfovirus sp. TaxID=2487768 RepID=A0A3G5A0C2_9VIRU|nr:MAG: hypothetical protein Harvfovirus3_47 [Harvfovirus sp.]